MMLLSLLLFTLISIGENLESIIPDRSVENWKPEMFIYHNHLFNWKTGERFKEPESCGGVGIGNYWPGDITFGESEDQFVWKCTRDRVDNSVHFQPVSCAGNQDRIHVGESRPVNNGSILITCDTVEGRIRRISEPVRGCYFNGTVHPLNWRWFEPNTNNNTFVTRYVTCEKSPEGYYQTKAIGCQFPIKGEEYYANVTMFTARSISEFTTVEVLMNATHRHPNGTIVQCVETEQGHLELINVAEEIKKPHVYCSYDNRTYELGDQWEDRKRGEYLSCESEGKVTKYGCLINGVRAWVNIEVKLSNGCTFLCHPQTNVYFCDNQLTGFKVQQTSTTMVLESVKNLHRIHI